MKKYLISSLLVLLTICLFLSCSSSPKEEESTYAVKVVFTNTECAEYNFDGTFYIKNADDMIKGYYYLYKDQECQTLTDIYLSINYITNQPSVCVLASGKTEDETWASCFPTDYNSQLNTDGTYATWPITPSETPFLDIDADSNCKGNIKLYANAAAVLKVNKVELGN